MCPARTTQTRRVTDVDVRKTIDQMEFEREEQTQQEILDRKVECKGKIELEGSA